MTEEVTPETVVKRVFQRNRLIENETKDPLRWACEPDIWRQIDLEMCKKRLAMPGLVLEVLVTGGIRAGKTEGATRRVNASFFYTPNSWVVGMHETDITSRSIQQMRVHRFLPPELDTSTGKHKRDKRTKFSYSEATGFTGAEFNIYWDCFNEDKVKVQCGGRFEFRFYKQDLSTLQGMELTCATSDELVPVQTVKTIRERLATRAADTAKPEFLARIRRAKAMLERGETLPVALLGALYHSVHIITFTPKEGWSPTVSSFLQGARKYGWVKSELLAGKPGVADPRVPRFAQPVERTRLVAYLHTSDNVMKPGYAAVREMLVGKSENEIRLVAHGDVDKSWMSTFSDYDEAWHVRNWKDWPTDATVYEICDPAGAKPWVIVWLLVDAAGRRWYTQEWPSPQWEIEGHGFPGPWAEPSETGKHNGDPGPAQRLRLKRWNRARYTRLIWEGRKRILQKLEEHGVKWKGRFVNRKLSWKDREDWKLEGPFVDAEESWMDSRFAATKTENEDKEVVTLLEAMWGEENAIDFMPAPGDRLTEGDQLIQEALADDVMGLPKLIVNEECENLRFMFQTYSVPEFRDTTKAADEACKDFRDPVAYAELKGPEYVGKILMTSGGR
ncbi:hypothetical protein [Prosthecobacter sp.]|uniref:hypothetical protein n=1 Tax=Prosthecobacter sp. TaxID=1965333 RepID=UPI0037850F20